MKSTAEEQPNITSEEASLEYIHSGSSVLLLDASEENESKPEESVQGTTPDNVEPIPIKTNALLKYLGFISWKQVWMETKTNIQIILKISIPIVISSMCYILMSSTDLSFVGRLGSEFLAATSLGSSYADTLSFIAFGLVGGMDTLCSQAYGAKNYELVGIVLQRCLILTASVCIPISALFLVSEYFFLLIGKDPWVAYTASLYVKFLTPGLWFATFNRALTQFFVTQHITAPSLYIALISVVLNVALDYMFIYGSFQMGFVGAPIATSVSRFSQFCMLLLSAKLVKFEHSTWNGFEIKKAIEWKGMLQYLKFAIPSMLMLVLEVWGFSLTVFAASFFDEKSTAAHMITQNLSTLGYMLTLGISIGGSVVVGNRIGEGKPQIAKFTALLAMILTLFCTSVYGIFVSIARFFIVRLFTADSQVITIASNLLIISSFFVIVDGMQGCFLGIYRALGKQLLAASVNFIAYYIIGLPLGLFLAFWVAPKLDWLQPIGLWLGLLVALTIVSLLSFFIITLFVNWKKESERARKEVGGITTE